MSTTDQQLQMELITNLIKQTAESTALRISEELRKDVSKAYERIGVLEQAVGVGQYHDNGLRKQVNDMIAKCDTQTRACTKTFQQLNNLANQGSNAVNKWMWMCVGGGGALSGAATILVILYKLHLVIKP
jgi:hypothetical protein